MGVFEDKNVWRLLVVQACYLLYWIPARPDALHEVRMDNAQNEQTLNLLEATNTCSERSRTPWPSDCVQSSNRLR